MSEDVRAAAVGQLTAVYWINGPAGRLYVIGAASPVRAPGAPAGRRRPWVTSVRARACRSPAAVEDVGQVDAVTVVTAAGQMELS